VQLVTAQQEVVAARQQAAEQAARADAADSAVATLQATVEKGCVRPRGCWLGVRGEALQSERRFSPRGASVREALQSERRFSPRGCWG
jgi:hypothetical protein